MFLKILLMMLLIAVIDRLAHRHSPVTQPVHARKAHRPDMERV